jgi:hypothetical protein
MQGSNVARHYLCVPLGFGRVLDFANLTLFKTKPATQRALIKCLAEDLAMPWVISIDLEYFSYVLTCKGGPKIVGIPKVIR